MPEIPTDAAPAPVVDPDRERRLARVRALADLLDNAFTIPGTNWRAGWDSIIGLAPGIGDAATGLLAAYIVAEAARLGVPKRTLMRMAANVGIDLAGGVLPGVGDLFDLAFKANRKNLKLIEAHMARETERIRGRS